MSMILDVLVLVTVFLCMFIYTKRGFIKGVLGLCGFLIALITASLTKHLLMPTISAPIEKVLDSAAGGLLSHIFNTESTADSIASVIAFALLFVVYLIAIRLLTALLDRICKLPVLRKANHLLGFVLGAVIGLLYAQILSVALFTFSELFLAVQDFITAEAFEGSVVAKWMFEHNIFRLLMGLL